MNYLTTNDTLNSLQRSHDESCRVTSHGPVAVRSNTRALTTASTNLACRTTHFEPSFGKANGKETSLLGGNMKNKSSDMSRMLNGLNSTFLWHQNISLFLCLCVVVCIGPRIFESIFGLELISLINSSILRCSYRSVCGPERSPSGWYRAGRRAMYAFFSLRLFVSMLNTAQYFFL